MEKMNYQKNKLGAKADVPYKVVTATPTTIVIFANDCVDRVSCDRAVQDTSASGTIRKEVMQREGPILKLQPLNDNTRATTSMYPLEVTPQ